MGIAIRFLLVIDAFSQFSGTPPACPADLSLCLAKQLLDPTATASGSDCGSVDADVSACSWRRFEKAPLAPRITPFLIPANSRDTEVPDHKIDHVGEGIQIAVSAGAIFDDLDDAIESFGNGVGQIVLDKGEDVVEVRLQRADERAQPGYEREYSCRAVMRTAAISETSMVDLTLTSGRPSRSGSAGD